MSFQEDYDTMQTTQEIDLAFPDGDRGPVIQDGNVPTSSDPHPSTTSKLPYFDELAPLDSTLSELPYFDTSAPLGSTLSELPYLDKSAPLDSTASKPLPSANESVSLDSTASEPPPSANGSTLSDSTTSESPLSANEPTSCNLPASPSNSSLSDDKSTPLDSNKSKPPFLLRLATGFKAIISRGKPVNRPEPPCHCLQEDVYRPILILKSEKLGPSPVYGLQARLGEEKDHCRTIHFKCTAEPIACFHFKEIILRVGFSELDHPTSIRVEGFTEEVKSSLTIDVTHKSDEKVSASVGASNTISANVGAEACYGKEFKRPEADTFRGSWFDSTQVQWRWAASDVSAHGLEGRVEFCVQIPATVTQGVRACFRVDCTMDPSYPWSDKYNIPKKNKEDHIPKLHFKDS